MMTQLSLEALQKRHEELLKLHESMEISEADITQVDVFLKELAAAGAYIEDPDQRSLLRAYIRYWASFVDEKTGSFPSDQLQPFPITGLPGGGGTENITGNLKTSVTGQDSIRAKRFSRMPLILIIAVVVIIIIIVIASFVLPLLNPMASAMQLNCSPASINTAQPSSSPISTLTPSASPLPWICSTPIPQEKNKLFTTAPDKWTIIQGDVSYSDPNGSQNFVSVKSAVDPTGSNPNVGSLLAVRGPSTIQAPYGGSFDLFLGNSTHEQIGQIVLQHEQNLLHGGCNGGCKVVSTVIICNGKIIYSGEITSSLDKSLQRC